jgi:hypothetical protein
MRKVTRFAFFETPYTIGFTSKECEFAYFGLICFELLFCCFSVKSVNRNERLPDKIDFIHVWKDTFLSFVFQ